MAFTGGHHAHGPSPQPTECRPLVCISIICSGWLGTFPTVDSYTIKTKQHDVGNDNDNKGCDLCRSEQALLSYLLSPFCIKIFTTLQN